MESGDLLYFFFDDSPERFRPERIRIQRGMRANERNPLFPVVLGIPPGPLERERKKSMTTWGGGEVEFGVNNNKASRGLTLNSAGSGQIGAHARRQSIVLGKKSTQCSWLFKLMTRRNCHQDWENSRSLKGGGEGNLRDDHHNNI